MKTVAIIIWMLAVSACSSPAGSQTATPPAKLSGQVVKEAELATITLTAEAENRLGIRLEAAKAGRGSDVKKFSGEIVEAAGSKIIVSTSVAGTLQAVAGVTAEVGASIRKGQPIFALVPFIPLPRDMRVTAETDIDQARTRVEAARLHKARADKMLADEVGTVRALEDAAHELALAASALEAAEKRLQQINSAPLDADVHIIIRAPQDGMIRQVLAAPGQTLNAGAPLFEVADLAEVWIRVPVYAGEAANLVPNAPVTVQALSGTGASFTASPVAAPPSADPASSTIHLYYRIGNPGVRFKPGEKLIVTLRASGQREWIEVPWSAIVFDTHGGSWVYESLGDRHYVRRRVDIDHIASSTAYLSLGVVAGNNVVADGAAELWGFEFGTGK